jgi:chitinase
MASLALWLASGALASASAVEPNSFAARSGGWVTAYYVGYQQHLLPPEKVDFRAITHLVVGRVTPNHDGTLNTTMDIDPLRGPALARDLVRRAHAAGRKALLMVGGAGEHARWRAAVAPSTQPTFVRNLAAALRDLGGYDGLDLDWEPIEEGDKPLLLALVRQLRAAVPGIVLTVPVGWVNVNTDLPVSRFYPELASVVDQMNVMTYSMADAWGWGWKSWHSSALDGAGGSTPTSVIASLEGYARAGVPRAKLGAGVGAYGSCWTGPVTGPGQEPRSSRVVASDNEMSYANIMARYFDASALRYDARAQASYLSFGVGRGPKACTFLSFEDERSVTAKARWLRDRGYGGVIVWTLGQAYLPATGQSPLLEALRANLLD